MAHRTFDSRWRYPVAAILLAQAAIAVPALAKGDVPSNTAKKAEDPDQQVCRQVRETGSRLKVHRVCMTKAQWDEQRRQDRMLIERSQMSSCIPGAGC